ncbi:MAG: hypothetical protein LBQ18_08565 [Campylobacteraceae bacterium]|jgi:hypothetical protein|nr:hypothetical protein [Campylobacteraceae bacterium]
MFRKIVLLTILMLGTLSAHKLSVFVYDDNGTLFIQSYFTKSSPCKNCEIIVKDTNDNEIAKLFTNDEGKASMDASQDEVVISVDGGMGHFQQTKYALKSLTKEDAQNLPSDMPWYNALIAFLIMAVIFGLLWFFKRKK